MAELKLYHLPGACSRVTMTALEHCGLDYEDEVVNLMQGQQHSPEYRAINPRGKIPALVVDGKLLGENAAIVSYLHMEHPEAGLLPPISDPLDGARQLADLFSISAGWHPSVRANRMPVRWTTGDPEEVRARGKQLLQPLLEGLEARLASRPFWYGQEWSIVDTYLYWNYTTAEEGQVDLSPFPNIASHRARVEAHPAFQRALVREKAAIERMGDAFYVP